MDFWVTYADSKKVTGTLELPLRVMLRDGVKIRTYNIEVIDGVQMIVKDDHILYRADAEVKDKAMIKENKPKLKAYSFTDEQTGYGEIDWFENAGQARSFFASVQGLHFCDVRVYRVPWADEYWSKGEVPPEVCLAHGWWWACCECGAQVSEEDVGKIDGYDVYCKECADKIGARLK